MTDEIKFDSKISETAKKYLKMDHVFLDTLDGYRFENLCAKIFRDVGYEVIETQYTNDKGRDLIIKKDGKTAFVECKHQKSSVGRPVIQKLDSAIRMEQADQGIVITSSTFSPEAIKYAEKLNPPIELKDIYSLTDLAEQAGIEISSTMSKTHILCYPVSHFSEIKKNLDVFFNRYRSHPKKGSEIINITSNILELQPKFLVTYDIYASFSTSIGEIYSINEVAKKIMVDAITSKVEEQRLVNFLKDTKLSYVADIPKEEYTIKRNQFNVNQTSLMEIIGNTIAKKYTTNVRYRGRNNQTYSKICTPRAKDIRIRDIHQVFLPLHKISMNAMSQEYNCTMNENNTTVLFQKSNLSTCKICNKQIKKEKLLCNDCGKISHAPKFFRAHGFICRKCGKTVCKNCNNSIRSFLFFKKNMCKACIKEISKKPSSNFAVKQIEANTKPEKVKTTVSLENNLNKEIKELSNKDIQKKAKVALLLSVVCGLFGFQGIGHIYSKSFLKGVVILFVSIIFAILFLSILSLELNNSTDIRYNAILLSILSSICISDLRY
jgi:restriction system protein